MSVLSRDEFLNKLKEKIGESTDDSDLKLIEDFTDTYDDLVSSAKPEIDWKKKYEENDKQWRERYVARFNGSDEDYNEDKRQCLTEAENKNFKYEDLFKEG